MNVFISDILFCGDIPSIESPGYCIEENRNQIHTI